MAKPEPFPLDGVYRNIAHILRHPNGRPPGEPARWIANDDQHQHLMFLSFEGVLSLINHPDRDWTITVYGHGTNGLLVCPPGTLLEVAVTLKTKKARSWGIGAVKDLLDLRENPVPNPDRS